MTARGNEVENEWLRRKTAPELWQPIGDLGNIVEGYLIDLAAQRSFLMRESLQRRLAELRDQLMNGGNSPLLAFLVHRVLTSWLDVEIRQIQAMQAQGEPANRKLQKRLDQAQRRHGESVVALRDFQNLRHSYAFAHLIIFIGGAAPSVGGTHSLGAPVKRRSGSVARIYSQGLIRLHVQSLLALPPRGLFSKEGVLDC